MVEKVRVLAKFFDQSLEGVVIANMKKADQPLIYCNDAFCKLTGYSREEVIGKNCRFLQGKDRDQAALVTLRSELKGKKPCKVVLRNYKKSGELFYNNLSISPLLNEKGEAEYFLGIQHDVTDLFMLREKIQDTEKENQVLIGEVHHRVKNNLAVMAGMLDLELAQQNKISSLEKSRIRLQSMAMIHEDLYNEDGLHRIQFNKFISKFVSKIDLIQEKRNLKLQYHLDVDEVILSVNQAIPLSVILAELLNNVYKHAYPNKEYGDVTICLSKNIEKEVSLEVRDRGVGFGKENMEGRFNKMGFTMVSQLTSQLNGKFDIKKCSEDCSTVVLVKFKQKDVAGSSQSKRIPFVQE
ncbi:PAS domain-containing protein [Gracilimonas sp.]|uniref:PAS domain-containing protein n=1 Tax=Gracilimonas sp. TaxID=1974203 RepID=UPI0032EE63D0